MKTYIIFINPYQFTIKYFIKIVSEIYPQYKNKISSIDASNKLRGYWNNTIKNPLERIYTSLKNSINILIKELKEKQDIDPIKNYEEKININICNIINDDFIKNHIIIHDDNINSDYLQILFVNPYQFTIKYFINIVSEIYPKYKNKISAIDSANKLKGYWNINIEDQLYKINIALKNSIKYLIIDLKNEKNIDPILHYENILNKDIMLNNILSIEKDNIIQVNCNYKPRIIHNKIKKLYT